MLEEEKVLDSPDRLFQWSVDHGHGTSSCILCEDFRDQSYGPMIEHYNNHHNISDLFFLEKIDKQQQHDSKRTAIGIQPPRDLESLVSLVYEARFDLYSGCVNSEAISFVAQEFAANSLNWMSDDPDWKPVLPHTDTKPHITARTPPITS